MDAAKVAFIQRSTEVVLIVVILVSFFGTYIGLFARPILHLSNLVVTMTAVVLLVERTLRNSRFDSVHVGFLAVCLATIFFAVIINQNFPSAYFFLIFLAVMLLLMDEANLSVDTLVKVTNITYLIYLFFSILVYVKMLPAPVDLEKRGAADLLFFSMRPFVGFFGSTAHIDSYSTVVVFINWLYSTNPRVKYTMSLLAGLAALLTFRSTPLLILVGAVSSGWIASKVRFLNFWIVTLLFGSFLMPFVVYYLFKNELYLIVLDWLLTGRASLWVDIALLYQKEPFYNQLVGFGVSEIFTVYSWGVEKANPHSLFFNTLIVYGIPVFLFLFVMVWRRLRNLPMKEKILLIAILLSGVGNSYIIGFTNLPFTLWFTFILANAFWKK